MQTEVIQCFPFANWFEEKVVLEVKRRLPHNFLLLHNFLRPNKAKHRIPKEIDLGVLSRSGDILVVEIKGYNKPPTIDETSMNYSMPNPLPEMKLYGQILQAEIKTTLGCWLYTTPCLVLKTKNEEKIIDK